MKNYIEVSEELKGILRRNPFKGYLGSHAWIKNDGVSYDHVGYEGSEIEDWIASAVQEIRKEKGIEVHIAVIEEEFTIMAFAEDANDIHLVDIGVNAMNTDMLEFIAGALRVLVFKINQGLFNQEVAE
tara:strand:+ start:3177 stop:3560 length:384 start_codon:yes stop_codon:yes gene_type:complete